MSHARGSEIVAHDGRHYDPFYDTFQDDSGISQPLKNMATTRVRAKQIIQAALPPLNVGSWKARKQTIQEDTPR
ncbi:hypothetical protein N7530_008441 [Penicillium desertorum]|uniref:Uncharacterized protein n=1 Tax=Penicillium desertorum TaxID=1303715 RepID=A0A9X0BKZ8_9EURO|nr:hypothetical protein N7530_008441 [Penicillium desertorum]